MIVPLKAYFSVVFKYIFKFTIFEKKNKINN